MQIDLFEVIFKTASKIEEYLIVAFEDAQPLESILKKLDNASERESATVEEILDEFGDRSFGPILTLCGAIMLTPIGAIPGVPAILSICILSSSIQLIIGRRKPWLPKRLQRLKVSSKRLKRTKNFLRPLFRRIDGIIRPRMSWAATKSTRVCVAITSIFLALALFVLAALPFGGIFPGLLIATFGLGIMVRDGLLLSVCFSAILGMIGTAALIA